MKKIAMAMTILILVTTTGCAKIWNPYREDFRCEGRGNDGKCTTTMGAYKDSMDVQAGESSVIDHDKTPPKKSKGWFSRKKEDPPPPPPTPGEVYDKNRYETLTGLVKEPKAPIVVPPTVVRVLIPPYAGNDNNMYDSRFVYFFATEPKWQFTTGMEGEE